MVGMPLIFQNDVFSILNALNESSKQELEYPKEKIEDIKKLMYL